MAIQFRCVGCNQPIEVDDDFANQQAECPYCHRVITVPDGSTLEQRRIAARPSKQADTPELPPRPTTDEARWTNPQDPNHADTPPPPPPQAPLPQSAGDLHVTHRDRPGDAAARSFGNFALISVALVVLLLGYFAFGAIEIVQNSNIQPPQTEEEAKRFQEELQQLVQSAPNAGLLSAAAFGGMFFGLVGFVLGVVSLAKSSLREWRGWVATLLTGGPLLCCCGLTAVGFLLPV